MNILGDIVKGVEGFAMGGPVGAAVGFGGALLGDVAGGSKSSGAGGAGDILSELTSLLGGGGAGGGLGQDIASLLGGGGGQGGGGADGILGAVEKLAPLALAFL
jgi:hypothetical protein